MNINVHKLIAPDFPIGRLLIRGKSIVDICTMLTARPSATSVRLARHILRIKPRHTMVRNKNLVALYSLVREVNRLGLPGDIVECGCWKGGSAAMMALADKEDTHHSKNRSIWIFDSFQGLPPPGEGDNREETDSYFDGWCKGGMHDVKRIFHELSLPLSRLNLVPGWFQDTLPNAEVQDICLLHIDADWYSSVKTVLDNLYDRVVPGGVIVFDDYNYWEGCNRALSDFLAERNLTENSVRLIGSSGAFFQKPL
jgi:O-methyltransferase